MGAEEEPQTKSETLSEAMRAIDEALLGSGWHVVIDADRQLAMIPFVPPEVPRISVVYAPEFRPPPYNVDPEEAA